MGDLRVVSGWRGHIPKGNRFDPSDLLKDESLPKSWVKALSEESDRDLFSDSGGRWVRRGEFLELSERAALEMHSSGLEPGDRIVLSSTASIDMVAKYVGALRLGLVVVPMNTAYTRSEVFHIVRDVKPSAAIVDSAKMAEWIAAGIRQPGFVEPFQGPGACLPMPKGDLQVFFTGAEPKVSPGLTVPLDEALGDTPALIAYTSGTTGRPKGAILTHGNLLACAKSLNIAWRWTNLDRLVLSLPLFHMHGLGVGINGTLCAGSSAVLLERFDPEAVIDAVKSHSASMFFGVPTMYQRLLDSKSLREFQTLRLMVSGSAPLSREVHREVADRCGTAILERYGTTESLIDISNPYEGGRKPGSVGFPLPGVEVAISTDNSEIFIGGPTVFKGYLNDPKATAAAFPYGKEWFATGDVGTVDDDGYVAIAGRLKDLIISGGYNVYPKEVEEALRSHPNVKDAAVVGAPSKLWGEEVVAFVIKFQDVSEEDLVLHASQFLASYKRPKRIFFVEEFPRNALGKVISAELRTMVPSWDQ